MMGECKLPKNFRFHENVPFSIRLKCKDGRNYLRTLHSLLDQIICFRNIKLPSDYAYRVHKLKGEVSEWEEKATIIVIDEETFGKSKYLEMDVVEGNKSASRKSSIMTRANLRVDWLLGRKNTSHSQNQNKKRENQSTVIDQLIKIAENTNIPFVTHSEFMNVLVYLESQNIQWHIIRGLPLTFMRKEGYIVVTWEEKSPMNNKHKQEIFMYQMLPGGHADFHKPYMNTVIGHPLFLREQETFLTTKHRDILQDKLEKKILKYDEERSRKFLAREISIKETELSQPVSFCYICKVTFENYKRHLGCKFHKRHLREKMDIYDNIDEELEGTNKENEERNRIIEEELVTLSHSFTFDLSLRKKELQILPNIKFEENSLELILEASETPMFSNLTKNKTQEELSLKELGNQDVNNNNNNNNNNNIKSEGNILGVPKLDVDVGPSAIGNGMISHIQISPYTSPQDGILLLHNSTENKSEDISVWLPTLRNEFLPSDMEHQIISEIEIEDKGENNGKRFSSLLEHEMREENGEENGVLSVEEECKSNKRFFRRLNNSEDDELIKNYKLLKLMESVEDENQNNLLKIQNNHLYNFTLSCIKGNKSENGGIQGIEEEETTSIGSLRYFDDFYGFGILNPKS